LQLDTIITIIITIIIIITSTISRRRRDHNNTNEPFKRKERNCCSFHKTPQNHHQHKGGLLLLQQQYSGESSAKATHLYMIPGGSCKWELSPLSLQYIDHIASTSCGNGPEPSQRVLLDSAMALGVGGVHPSNAAAQHTIETPLWNLSDELQDQELHPRPTILRLPRVTDEERPFQIPESSETKCTGQLQQKPMITSAVGWDEFESPPKTSVAPVTPERRTTHGTSNPDSPPTLDFAKWSDLLHGDWPSCSPIGTPSGALAPSNPHDKPHHPAGWDLEQGGGGCEEKHDDKDDENDLVRPSDGVSQGATLVAEVTPRVQKPRGLVCEPVCMTSEEGKPIHTDVMQTLRVFSRRQVHQLRKIVRVQQPEQDIWYNAAQEQNPIASSLYLYMPVQKGNLIRKNAYRFHKAQEHSRRRTWRDKCCSGSIGDCSHMDEFALYTHIGHALCSGHCDDNGEVRVLLVRVIVPKSGTRGQQVRRYGVGCMYTGVRQHMLKVQYELILERVN
jgi:hypothetical protein